VLITLRGCGSKTQSACEEEIRVELDRSVQSDLAD
jgi:hypothetical protein